MTYVNLAAEATGNPLVPVLPELIVGGIAFGLLCLVLMKKVFPKMEETFQARVEAIEGGMRRAEEAQLKANALLEQYQAQLAEARAEASTIRDEARAEGTRIVEELRNEAQEQARRIVTRGEQQLVTERARLVAEVRAEMGQLSVDLASKIVGEALDDEARRSRTVERFLEEIESTTPVAAGGR